MDGITRTDMRIHLAVTVSILTVTIPSSWKEAVEDPNAASVIP